MAWLPSWSGRVDTDPHLRLAGYRSIGYVEGELPLGYEADDDWTVGRGWDDELDENDTGEVLPEGG
jgi:hypothetical protein